MGPLTFPFEGELQERVPCAPLQNGEPRRCRLLSSVGDLRSALSEAKSGGKHDVLMQVKTAENTHFVAMPIG
jgi:hypothetical protein